ncbi:UDP-N-acetylmuramoyl-L-alanyl-D-glutamate--2,6-diaminopimelate ligase [Nocardiopsis sp. CT-R113]|uniref:UDP-N-acetylmuramoyl-L-alanyl-D-glutamate--2,6-diaminopimelate ligase n=1 Tax=Nocardiopsis codii TaxID=3065942 RepID=A0ABU7KEX7_9ACTN|nr:UDP-N-acetylmuramoyl-L-alanyl-D-glutamate--2,6-diaminopimelate ligase [Nocardiopsis sp. CT-R113]MEE2040790.1 UDP-N-acetylmuramoyl-L-alanyl-D-glutamate--2,6-diaminopimelate ligase [Nocardiopsis sp. CT-R113]
MKLSELLEGHDHQVLHGDPDSRITAGPCLDVHRVAPGSLYVAVPGHDGGGTAGAVPALVRGAAAVLLEAGPPGAPPWSAHPDACVVRVADARTAAAVVSARYYGHPGRGMDVVAVTGTNGKTSVSSMYESLLSLAKGARVGVIGTSGSRTGGDPVPMPRSVLSTPESPDLQYILGRMRDRGTVSVVLEATSMGLLHHRVDGSFVDVGIFTNLTQDHLDDHGTMENYRDAKLRLFRGMCRHAVVNADDPVGAAIPAMMPGAVTTYAIEAEADYRATDLVVDASGTRFVLHHDGRKYPAAIPVPGRFSVSNALAAVAACHRFGHELGPLVDALERMPQIPGRFEHFDAPRGVSVIVDYAHSPDSLDKVLQTIRGFARGRVLTVFGCGGDRDTTKRARMGEIAGTYSDLCFLTSDNPRGEDPEAIMDQVAPGIAVTGTPFERLGDRRGAISAALAAAEPGDVVLLAGKGSESHQIVGDALLPFDDMATVRELSRD